MGSIESNGVERSPLTADCWWSYSVEWSVSLDARARIKEFYICLSLSGSFSWFKYAFMKASVFSADRFVGDILAACKSLSPFELDRGRICWADYWRSSWRSTILAAVERAFTMLPLGLHVGGLPDVEVGTRVVPSRSESSAYFSTSNLLILLIGLVWTARLLFKIFWLLTPKTL